MSAKHYQLFRSENAQNRSPETGGQFAKARHWRTPFYEYLGQFLRKRPFLTRRSDFGV
jgi:hypothetical protein